MAVVPVDATDATATAERVRDIRTTSRRICRGSPHRSPAGSRPADLAAVFEGANTRLLIATASVVALLLVLTYRSPILWIFPLLVVGVADRLAAVLATHTLAAFSIVWDESTIGILSVLVFGRGHRLRAAAHLALPRRAAQPRRSARGHVARPAPHLGAVLSSAVTVTIGL